MGLLKRSGCKPFVIACKKVAFKWSSATCKRLQALKQNLCWRKTNGRIALIFATNDQRANAVKDAVMDLPERTNGKWRKKRRITFL